MKEQVDNAIEWIKKQPIRGCITGSVLLENNPEWNQDIDLFVYDEKSFAKILFAMHHADIFSILDPLEKWKFDQYIDKEEKSFYKFGLITIKFNYNLSVPVNIILKKNCNNAFSVLSSFDLDIICKAYDIQTSLTMDLSENKGSNVATWNKWNPSYYSTEIWQMSRVLRQLERCFKYHKRGYKTDEVVKKYIEIVDRLVKYESVFSSKDFNEKLVVTKSNTKIIKDIANLWLETHEISDQQLELLREKTKEI